MKLISPFLLLLFISDAANGAAPIIGRHVDLYFIASCTEYAQYRKEPEGSANGSAIMGYVAGWLSATNLYGDPKHEVTGDDAVPRAVLWLDGFCTRHPKSGLQEGLVWFNQHGATPSEPEDEVAPR